MPNAMVRWPPKSRFFELLQLLFDNKAAYACHSALIPIGHLSRTREAEVAGDTNGQRKNKFFELFPNIDATPHLVFERVILQLIVPGRITLTMLLDSKQQQIHELLELVCHEIQLTDTQYENSQTSYEAVGNWLTGGALTLLLPDVYAQGSRLLGTSIRPREIEEFDIDAVCRLNYGFGVRPEPMKVYDDVRRRLAEHETYRNMMEPLDRCIRLNYAEGTRFHLDIVPAIPFPLAGELHGEFGILIPDREKRGWVPTNPLGFAKWFAARSVLNLSSYEQRVKLSATVHPLPPAQESGEKAVLQREAQLFKRRRDVHFGDNDKAPKSILLTALNGYCYNGESLIGEAITNALARIITQYRSTWPHVPMVPNPTRRDENLARHWLEDKNHYDNFIEYAELFQAGMRRLSTEQGLDQQAKILNELFDPKGTGIVNRAVKTYTERFQNARLGGDIVMSSSTLRNAMSSTTAAARIAFPGTSFFGD